MTLSGSHVRWLWLTFGVGGWSSSPRWTWGQLFSPSALSVFCEKNKEWTMPVFAIIFPVLWVGSTLLPHVRAGDRQLCDPHSKIPSLHRIAAPWQRVISCTVPRRHGRITHQHGGRTVRKDPPGSSRWRVDGREELEGSEVPTGGSVPLLEVKNCGNRFPYDLGVARPQRVAAVRANEQLSFL